MHLAGGKSVSTCGLADFYCYTKTCLDLQTCNVSQQPARLTDEKKDDDTGHAEDSTYRLSDWEELGPKAQPRNRWSGLLVSELRFRSHKESCCSLLDSLLDHAARVLALQWV